MPASKFLTAADSAPCADLHFIRRLNGSTQSMLVQDDKEQFWILKPKTSVQGPNTLANEFIGSDLCQSLGLPFPHFKIVKVGEQFCSDPRVFVRGSRGPEMIQPGLHFVSRHLSNQTGRIVLEFVPPALRSNITDHFNLLGMFLFDIWAFHGDNRQALFTSDGNLLRPTFIDNSHLFGGPDGTCTNPVINGHYLQEYALTMSRECENVEAWIQRMSEILPDALGKAIEDAPTEWYSGDYSHLSQTLLARLQNLSNLARTVFAQLESQLRYIREGERHCLADSGVLQNRAARGWS